MQLQHDRHDVVYDLQQHPGHDGVGRGHAVDMAALQFREEIRHALRPGPCAGLLAPLGIEWKATNTSG